MITTVTKLLINELDNQISFDIASNSPTNFIIHSIIVDKASNIEITNGIPAPGVTPLLLIESSDIIDNDATQQTFNTVLNVNNLDDSLIYIFVYYAAVSSPTIIAPAQTDVFCIYNLYNYVKNYMILSKQINQNNPAPKAIIDLIILRKTLEYAIINGDYEKANEYFTQIKSYYV